jgi:hypothetical protein
VKPLVRLVGEALSPALFGRVRRGVVALGEERLRSTYQTTFWAPLGAAPSCVVEQALPALLAHAKPPRKVIGIEWWLSRMRTSNVRVDFHQDCDERLYRAGGPVVHPVLSSVLFLNTCVGGLLAVTRQEPVADNPALAPLPLDADLVEPQPNRYVIFEGALTHGVLDARNQLPGPRLLRQPKLRLTIAVNYWHQRPTGVPRFGESKAYRSLMLRP